MSKNLKAEFDEILKKVKNKEVDKTPGVLDKLKLYAWYKQALFGDVKGEAPDDMTEKMKFEAWSKVKGMTKEDAMKNYIKYFS